MDSAAEKIARAICVRLIGMGDLSPDELFCVILLVCLCCFLLGLVHLFWFPVSR